MKQADWARPVVAIGVLALVGVGVYLYVTDEPEEARQIRREADNKLRAGAVWIAQTHENRHIRERARSGVEFADREWFWKKLSGNRPPEGLPSRIHGNRCGSGGSGPVTDELDELCFQHDQAYQRADEVAARWRQQRNLFG